VPSLFTELACIRRLERIRTASVLAEVNRRHNAVLLVDRDVARARRSAALLGCERWGISIANSIAEALVLMAIRPYHLAIVTLGENSEPRTCASALRMIAPSLRILFTGDIAPHRSDAIDAVDAGEHYLPLSHARLRTLLHRRPVGRVLPTMLVSN
jgi:hypothetical protein